MDIVEQLRGIDATNEMNMAAHWCGLAADEIERLRTLLNGVRTYLDSLAFCGNSKAGKMAKEIAKAMGN